MKTESLQPVPANPPSTRRNFLLGASIASAGAVAAVAVFKGGTTSEIVAAVADKPVKTRGYHLTPHIAQYYETTKL